MIPLTTMKLLLGQFAAGLTCLLVCIPARSLESRPAPLLYAQNLDAPIVPPANAPDPEDSLSEPSIPEDLPDLPPSELPDVPVEQPPEPPVDFPTAPEVGRFRVGAIELLGVTLDAAELNQLTAEFQGDRVSVGDRLAAIEGQEVTLDDLLALRAFITDAYVEAGYITSGAFLPEQSFTDGGIVQIQVIEGLLETLEVRGLKRLKDKYIRDRMALRLGRPLQQTEIVEALQLLQLDSLIEAVNAELLAGSGPGFSILVLTVEEAPAWSGGFSINNYLSPSVGSEQINPYVSYTNLLGVGDRFDASYSLSRGVNSYDFNYTVPITPQDGTVNFRLATGNSRVIEAGFGDLGIRGESRTMSLGIRQPLIKTPNTELALGLSFDLRRSQTFIFDDVKTFFSRGTEDSLGESRVSVVRFSQDWLQRSPNRVLAARSQFSLGIDAFDATINDLGIDGEFLSWSGQFQWVQRLPEDRLLITRVSGQLTPDPLLPLEQFSLGGVRTVRGYRENQLVLDNGLTASLELRLPLSAIPNELQLTPFIEGGLGWNSGEDAGNVEELASIGVGLQWQIEPDLRLSLDYGYPLIEPDFVEDTLQEYGVYISLNWTFGE